ncbi:MAG: lysostaphin resistance A-like protein [Pirellula sp.]
MIDSQQLAPWQMVLVSVFSLLALSGLVASMALHAWVLQRFSWVVQWVGWYRDRPRAWVGAVDLVVFVACMIFVQTLIVGVIVGFRGKPAVPAAPAVAAVGLIADSPAPAFQESLDGVETMQIVDEETESPTVTGAKTPEVPTWLTQVLGIALLLGALLAAWLLVVRTRASPVDLGYWSGRWMGDLWIGLLAFLWVTPLVILQSQIAVRLTNVEYDHPVIDAMKDQPSAYPLLFFGAVICAPIWEEFAFRALLIGWLDTLRFSKWRWRTILFGTRDPQAMDPLSQTETNSPAPEQSGDGELRGDSSNPYEVIPSALQRPSASMAVVPLGGVSELDAGSQIGMAGVPVGTAAKSGGEAEPTLATEALPPWWPAIVSGVLFGLAHFGYGVSWVPLMTLGVVQGRLFQLRRSLIPCIVVHGLFNSMSMMGLAINIFIAKPE